jgi:hypothetical protein
MESFFLAETLKYLYLIFDKDNFLFSDSSPKTVKNLKCECLVETGFYIFNTEAHPIDGASLDCCQRLNFNKNKNIMNTIDMNGILERYAQLHSGLRRRREKVVPSFCNFDFNGLGNLTNLDFIYACNLSDYFKTKFHSMSSSGQFYYP